ncbi:MAG: carbohydrate ABC transporter permease [Clostridiales bacterium]
MRVILLFTIAGYLLPILFSIITSFKTNTEFYQNTWGLPKKLLFKNYVDAFQIGHIGDYFLNSVIISVFSLILIQVISLLMAYALARMKIPYAEIVLLLLLVIQVLPTESTVIPLYIMVAKSGIINSPYFTIILAYVGWSVPGTTIIMKNYLKTLPEDLLEAARIDGSGELQTMVRIILPLMKGAMATCFVFNFTFVWGELMWAQIATLLSDKGIPLTVGLLNFQGTYSTNWPMLAAAICMVAIPLFVAFLFLQKYLVSGLTAGSVKG